MKNINLMNIPLLKGKVGKSVSLALSLLYFFTKRIILRRGQFVGLGKVALVVGLLFGGVDNVFGQCDNPVMNLGVTGIEDSSATIFWDPIAGTAPVSYLVTVQEDAGGTFIVNSFSVVDTFFIMSGTLDANQEYDVRITPVCNGITGIAADDDFDNPGGLFSTLSTLPTIVISDSTDPQCASGTDSDGSIEIIVSDLDFTNCGSSGVFSTEFDIVFIQGGTVSIPVTSPALPANAATVSTTITTNAVLDTGTYQVALIFDSSDETNCNYDLNGDGLAGDTLALSNIVLLESQSTVQPDIRVQFVAEGGTFDGAGNDLLDTILTDANSVGIVHEFDLGAITAMCDTSFNIRVRGVSGACDLDSITLQIDGVEVGTNPNPTGQAMNSNANNFPFTSGSHTIVTQVIDVNGNTSDSVVYKFDLIIQDPSDPVTFLAFGDDVNNDNTAPPQNPPNIIDDITLGTITQSNVMSSFDTTIMIMSCDTMMQFAIANVDSCGHSIMGDSLSIDGGVTFMPMGVGAITAFPTNPSPLFGIMDPTSASSMLVGVEGVTPLMSFSEGTHQIIYKAVDNNGNPSSNILNITLENNSVVTATAITQHDAAPICVGDVATFIGSSVGGNATTGEWTISPVTAGANVIQNGQTLVPASATFSSIVPGTYTLILTTDDPDGMGLCMPAVDSVVIVVIETQPPTGDAAPLICAIDNPSPTIADLIIVGTGPTWYSAAMGGTVLPTTTALVSGTTYYVSQTVNGCESTVRLAVTPIIDDPVVPTADSPQNFCLFNNPTVANLTTLTGNNIQWYNVPTGGISLPSTTALPAGTAIYYASQTVGTCESATRVPVTVNVDDTPAPTTTNNSPPFCTIDNPTIADLAISTLTFSSITWYDAVSGGNMLPTTTALMNATTYYASQTINGCESILRLGISPVLSDPISPTGDIAPIFCSLTTPTVANLFANGSNIQWYAVATGGTALPASTALVDGTSYFASQTVSNCESSIRFEALVTVGDPIAPTGAAAQSFCTATNPTVGNIVANGSMITWYTSMTGGTALAANQTLTAGTYYATQTVGGCESDERLEVTVTVDTTPIVSATDTNDPLCSGDNTNILVINLNNVTGTMYNWTALANANISELAGGDVMMTNVAVNTPIVMSLTNSSTNAVPVIFLITPVGPTGCVGNTITETVTVITDNTAPTAVCPSGPQQVQLVTNPVTMTCEAILPNYSGLSSGNCGIDTITQMPSAGIAITANTVVTLTVTDEAGNPPGECSFTVNVFETVDPTITCPSDQQATFLNCDPPYEIIDFRDTLGTVAMDNCGMPDIVQSPAVGTAFSRDTSFTVTLSAVDAFGNRDACSFTLNLTSTILPIIVDTTVQCEEAIIMTPFAIFNCVDTVFAFPASSESENGTTPETHTFASNGLTTRTIRWFFDDSIGNVFTRSQVITYGTDMTAPVAVCLPNTTNISVDSFGMVVIDPADLAIVITDNCSTMDSLTFGSSMATIPCDSLNTTFDIDIYVEDAAGNRDTCSAAIKIVDTIAPIFFDVPANDTINCDQPVPAQVMITPVDNCGMVVIDSTMMTMVSTQADTPSVAIPRLDSTFYNYTVTYSWIAQDTAGNRDTAVQVIVVEDTEGPIVNYPDTLIVPAMGTACSGSAVLDLGANVFDKCSDTLQVFQYSTTPTFTNATTINIADSNNVVTIDTIIGSMTAYIRATDFSNNTTIDTLTIMVMDQEAPIASCATSVSVSIGASGSLILVPADIDQNSRDACSTPTLTLSRDSFACADIGQTFSIILTATDTSGNAASCTSMVTIQQGNSAPCGSGGGNNNMDCAGFNITSITATAPTAVGANDGTATVVGGGASGMYNYQWVFGNLIVGDTPTIAGLAPGTYSVTVTDQVNANCTTSQTVVVPAATPITPPTTGSGPVQFILCDVAGAPGSTVQVPVKVVGFNNVTSFAMSYNLASTAGAQFVTPNPIGSPAFTSISSGPNNSSRVNVMWLSSTGESLADSTVIFTISMVLGNNNAAVPITIGGAGNATDLEVAGILNGQSVFLESTGIGNTVTVGTGGGVVNPPVDPPANDLTIRGTITVEDLRGVEGANVNITSGVATSTTTNATGNYALLADANTTYTIMPFEDDNHINGVNLGDMIRIARHIVQIDFLDSPLQLIAADVNRDGRVNSRDRSEIFQIVLGRESRFDNNTSWRFIPKTHVFPASAMPPMGQPGTSYPESITVNSGAMGIANLDFWAVKIGDVDSMATVPFRNAPMATSRSSEKMAFRVQDQLVAAGTRIAVPFKANEFSDLLGYQMTIDGSAGLSLAEVEAGALNVSMSNFYQNERQANQLSTVWYTPEAQTIADDETLFTLYFDVKEDGHLQDLLNINSEFIEALAIDAKDNHLAVGIEFEAAVLPAGEAVSTSFELYQNRPNPFRSTTTIGFNLPTSETATLSVFDLAGRQLHKVTQVYQKGYNEVLINSSQWTSGVLYYELETATEVARHKMILIE